MPSGSLESFQCRLPFAISVAFAEVSVRSSGWVNISAMMRHADRAVLCSLLIWQTWAQPPRKGDGGAPPAPAPCTTCEPGENMCTGSILMPLETTWLTRSMCGSQKVHLQTPQQSCTSTRAVLSASTREPKAMMSSILGLCVHLRRISADSHQVLLQRH